jgi:hypothetical protein
LKQNDYIYPNAKEISKANVLLCKGKKNADFSEVTYLPKMSRKIDSFSLDDYPIFVIATQLTLIEWDNFLDIHPCHCLNSKAQGINLDSKSPINTDNMKYFVNATRLSDGSNFK